MESQNKKARPFCGLASVLLIRQMATQCSRKVLCIRYIRTNVQQTILIRYNPHYMTCKDHRILSVHIFSFRIPYKKIRYHYMMYKLCQVAFCTLKPTPSINPIMRPSRFLTSERGVINLSLSHLNSVQVGCCHIYTALISTVFQRKYSTMM